MMLLKSFLFVLMTAFMSLLNAAEIRVGAASNLRFVLPELAQSFQQQTGHQLHISFAASGTLVSQIQHGAPFDVFMSANPDYISRLKLAGYTQGNAVDFAQALLALYSNNDSELTLDSELNSIKQALQNNTLKKIVIANPQHAPYGQLAKQLLQQQGLWQQVQTHLLIAENAAQSLQFSMSPQVSIGFVPYTCVIQPKIAETGRSLKLNLSLLQQAIIVGDADDSAQLWLAYLSSPKAKQILLKHGFLVNDETIP
ncbi:MAG: molybdate ABC transporter substrate-binding protein [Gammaproteobacteria bacterium]|nr:molybdate ABC transporter substrate-binding protein [Gammaproteobacteria bacterium]